MRPAPRGAFCVRTPNINATSTQAQKNRIRRHRSALAGIAPHSRALNVCVLSLFVWRSARDGKIALTPAQLAMLLEGIDRRLPRT
jgi:transposase